jgi:hypothetical protein
LVQFLGAAGGELHLQGGGLASPKRMAALIETRVLQ